MESAIAGMTPQKSNTGKKKFSPNFLAVIQANKGKQQIERKPVDNDMTVSV